MGEGGALNKDETQTRLVFHDVAEDKVSKLVWGFTCHQWRRFLQKSNQKTETLGEQTHSPSICCIINHNFQVVFLYWFRLREQDGNFCNNHCGTQCSRKILYPTNGSVSETCSRSKYFPLSQFYSSLCSLSQTPELCFSTFTVTKKRLPTKLDSFKRGHRVILILQGK